MFSRFTGFVARVSGEAGRTFSSSSCSDKRFLRISMDKSIAEEFCSIAQAHYEKFNDDSFALKALTIEEGESATKELQKLVKKDKKLDEAFKSARQDDYLVKLVEGVEIPDIEKSKIPTISSDFDNKIFAKEIRPAQVISYAYGRMIGISPECYTGSDSLITGIYATMSDQESVSSYKSDKELKWHNDGWSSGEAIPRLFLLGAVGKDGVFTEVAYSEDVIKYFVKNGRQDLLKALGREQIIDDDEFTPITILDQKSGKVNYANYGEFRPRGGDIKLYEAIDFLNQGLEEIPHFRINIQKGQMLALNNQKVLHRKITDPSIAVGSAIGERLLLRGLGRSADLEA